METKSRCESACGVFFRLKGCWWIFFFSFFGVFVFVFFLEILRKGVATTVTLGRMHGTLCLVVAWGVLFGSARGAFVPSEEDMFSLARELGAYSSRGNGNQRWAERFAEGARVCWDGVCGGVEVVARSENIVDTLTVQVPTAQLVVGANYTASRWHSIARVGKCRKQWSGTHVVYFDGQGKISEYHDWPDYDVTQDLAWLTKKCGPPTLG